VFDAEVAIILSQSNSLLPAPHSSSTLKLDEKELGVAIWVFENGKPAGRFTDTLPMATAQYLPLLTSERTVGVIGIHPHQDIRPSPDQEVLMETFASQIALVIERELLDEAAEHTAMLQESERLYTTLLNSISHELRTPIATITGAASSLLDSQMRVDEPARSQLTRDIQDAADRLNRLVENLLDMSRLESGRLKLKLEWCDVGDVISVAVKRLEKCLLDRSLKIDKSANLPLVQMDFALIEQVLVNLLDNACTYSPSETPIEIQAIHEDGTVSISITDYGPGIPAEDIERVFEKFYRIPGSATGGTGLGLSICRGLVEAHGGSLTAENVPGAGARFTIKLPANTTPPPVKEALL
jgi:two-component system sensor histidine kinase KdpD